MNPEARARFITNFRKLYLQSQGRAESPAAPAALMTGSSGPTASPSIAPAYANGTAVVHAGAHPEPSAVGIPGLDASPLPGSLSAVLPSGQELSMPPTSRADSGRRIPNGASRAAPGATMGAEVLGARRASLRWGPDPNREQARQTPSRGEGAPRRDGGSQRAAPCETKTQPAPSPVQPAVKLQPPPRAEALPSLPQQQPQPQPVPTHPPSLMAEFDAIVAQTPEQLLQRYSAQMDQMRSLLHKIAPDKGAVLVKSVRELLLGDLPPQSANENGAVEASISQPSKAPVVVKPNAVPIAPNRLIVPSRMARVPALQQPGAKSTPAAATAAAASIQQPSAVSSGVSAAQSATVPMTRGAAAAAARSEAPAVVAVTAPLGRMTRAGGAVPVAPPWASTAIRESAALIVDPATGAAVTRMQIGAAASQFQPVPHPVVPGPPPAYPWGVPWLIPGPRPPPGSPPPRPAAPAVPGVDPAAVASGSGSLSGSVAQPDAAAQRKPLEDKVQDLHEEFMRLAESEKAKPGIRIKETMIHAGRTRSGPGQTGWECRVSWNNEVGLQTCLPEIRARPGMGPVTKPHPSYACPDVKLECHLTG